MLRRTLLLVAVALVGGVATAAEEPPVSICADADPPPSIYWQRDAAGKKTRELVGFEVDLMRAAFARLGRGVEFTGDLPWKRCMLMVQQGRYDFAMGAYYDDERAKQFAYSVHYHSLTPQVFTRRADPPAIKEAADLKRYRGCGMMGASYAHYGLDAALLDQGKTHEQLVQKLKFKRCDFFVEEQEVFLGYKLLGTDYLADPVLQHHGLPGVKPPSTHVIAAKGSVAAQLLPKLNVALEELIKSGAAAAMWKKHAGDLPYKP